MHPQDADTMEIYDELKSLHDKGTPVLQIQEYLIGCVESQQKFRSAEVITRAIDIWKRWLKGVGDISEVTDLDWYLEAEAFEIDHFIENIDKDLSKQTLHDLETVQSCLGLDRDQALNYLRDLVYFIDEVACFIAYTENGIPRKQYSQFLNYELFEKTFSKNV